MDNQPISAIRGMNDILPAAIHYWQQLETVLRKVMARYGYEEIRFPILEYANLFVRLVGESSDIIAKETYTFTDRNGEMLTLRPEGTAGCARALVQNGLWRARPTQRLWYSGPMFRYERPQQGRYRQFHQLGVEVFGVPGVDIMAELLLLNARFWQELGLAGEITLHINSLGSTRSRHVYRDSLVQYFTLHQAELDIDSQQRLLKNPLRILDSKNPAMTTLIQGAPKISDYLDAESKAQLTQLCDYLQHVGLPYILDPYLVRGLDYYTGLVFEWITTSLGAQGTVCAGGRYDDLVAELGGPALPAIGFAMGLERLVLLMQQYAPISVVNTHVCLLSLGVAAEKQALRLAEQLRSALPKLRLLTACGGGSFKSQFKYADKSGAMLALVLGEDEAAQQHVTVKYLREARDQLTIPQTEMVELLKFYLAPAIL